MRAVIQAAELKTAEEVRAHATAVQRRISARYKPVKRAKPVEPEPPPASPQPEPAPTSELMPKPISPVRTVLALAGRQYGVPLGDLLGPSRSTETVLARFVGLYVARRLWGTYLTKLGKAAKRDHTSVLHACKSVEDRIRHDRAFAAVVDAIGVKAASLFGVHWTPVDESDAESEAAE